MDDELDDSRRDYYLTVAQQLRVPVDTLLFIYDALNNAAQYAGEEPDDVAAVPRHCSAAELCNAVKLYAADLWDESAPSMLTELGLKSSEDLGRIVFGLADAGLMDTEPNDRVEDFVGVCRFDSA